MEELEYYNNYEKFLEQELLKFCTSAQMLEGTMLGSEDIDDKWNTYANDYMADAIEQINSYPQVSMAWAFYMGLAVAQWWDTDWLANKDNEYTKFYGTRGFDNLDDHIVMAILGLDLDSEEAQKITSTAYSCAQLCIGIIRKENIEFGSAKAFYILSRTVKVMYKIGAAVQLNRLGYKFQKLQ